MSAPASHPVLFDYPPRAALGRVVPKTRLYAAGKPSRRVRDQFATKVAQVVWQYKLAPETVNLPASRGVTEIQVFSLTFKSAGDEEELPEDILRCIDRAIGFPILFELTVSRDDGAASDQVRVAATYKRPNEADAGKWVIGEYFATDWLPAGTPRSPLPVALDLGRLYEQILSQLIPVPARQGESMAALVERQGRIAVKQRECRRLEARVHSEKQFNRKVELNRQLHELRAELDRLTS